MAERYLSIPQVAERMPAGTSPAAVYRLLYRRRIPFLKLGRRVLVPESKLEAALAALTVPVQALNHNGGRP